MAWYSINALLRTLPTWPAGAYSPNPRGPGALPTPPLPPLPPLPLPTAAPAPSSPARTGQLVAASAPDDGEVTTPAMRPSPYNWRPATVPQSPERAMAAMWRAQMLSGLNAAATSANSAAATATAASSHAPARLPPPARVDADLRPALPAGPSPADTWLLQTWQGIPVRMQLLQSDDDETASPPPSPSAITTTALRLSLDLPQLGRLALQLQPVRGGVRLTISVERDDAVEPVRAALPALARALAEAEMPLLSCRLQRLGTGPHAGKPPLGWATAAMLDGVVRAAAVATQALIAADAAAGLAASGVFPAA